MASSKWKTWKEIIAVSKTRNIVFWGASHWIERSLEKTGPIGNYVVDNNPNNQGIEFTGLPVKAPKALLDDQEKAFVIITTANYSSVIEEIHKMGFVMGDDFCCTPLLMEQRDSDDLRNLDTKVLISSPQHFSNEVSGGGLYLFETKEHQLTKLQSGKCRGLARAHDGYLLVDMLRGVVVLDKDFKETGLLELPHKCEPHGVAFDPSTNHVFVAQPGRDSIGVYELNSNKILDEIFISDKWKSNQKDNHHINDLCVVDDSIFVSMFSFTGNWMHEVYDGGVMEISISKSEIIGSTVDGLWCPHSVTRFNGELVVLDSMRGEIVQMNWKRLGQFSTFVRGLDYNGKYYFVGMSGFRHSDKLSGIAKMIGVDAGFSVFDPKSCLSRTFVQNAFESVHSVLAVNN